MSLSLSQQEALEQLWAVTASDTTPARKRDERILREAGWDVQRAAEQIFSEATSAPTTRGGETSRGPSRSTTVDEADGLRVNTPPGSRRLSGTGGFHRGSSGAGTSGVGLWGLLSSPVRLIWSILTGTWYFFIRTFVPLSFLPRLPRFLLPPNGAQSQNRTQTPTQTSLAFIRDLEVFTGCSAGTNSLPDFYIGPYREFMLNVRKEGKVGVVIVVCGEHEDDEEFKRDVLCDAELVRTFKEKDLMVWAADVRSREGYQVAQTLLHTTYPSITFVSLLPASPTSNSTSSPKLSVLTSISGRPSTTTSASSIIQTLNTSVLPRATPFLNRLKRERLTLAEARHLREEQDRAFKDAERRDRAKTDAQKQAAELERLKSERAAKDASDKQQRISNRKQWRRYARKHLLPPSAGPLRVALRTPLNADRNVRNFEAGPSTLPLFVYAETLLIPAADDPADDPDSPPAGYEPEWDFKIVTTYPRKEITRVETGGEEIWDVVKGAGGALFAEKAEGSVWGEAETRELNGDDSDEDEVVDE